MFVQTKSNPINQFNRSPSTADSQDAVEIRIDSFVMTARPQPKKSEADVSKVPVATTGCPQPKKAGALFSKDKMPCMNTARWIGNIHGTF